MAALSRAAAVAITTYQEQTAAPVSSAANRALAVPELLENVLLKLHEPGAYQNWTDGITDLFVVQRVSQDFRNATRASIHLRRAMRLEYDEESGTRKYGLHFLLDGDAGRLRRDRNFPRITMWGYTNGPYGNEEVLFDCKYDIAKTSTADVDDPAAEVVSKQSSSTALRRRTTPKRLVTLTHDKFFSKDASWRHMKLFGHAMPVCIRSFSDVRLRDGGVYGVATWPVFVFDHPAQLLGVACTGMLAFAARTGPWCDHHLRACENADKRWCAAGKQWALGADLDHPVVRKHVNFVRKHNAAGSCGREKASCAWCSAAGWALWTLDQAELVPMIDVMATASVKGLI